MSDETSHGKASWSVSADLKASVRAVTLPSGLYLFTVRVATPVGVPKAGNLPFPALHVTAGPGSPPSTVEFVSSPNSFGAWLYKTGDTLIVKIGQSGSTLILSSIRAEGTQPLDVKVERLDKTGSGSIMPATLPIRGKRGATPADSLSPARNESLKLRLGLQVRGGVALDHIGSDWAGRIAEKSWIEAISIVPLEKLSPRDIEYRGLSANGFETQWLSDGAVCGTRGANTPLIGFAVRLKPDAAALHDCEYSGYFHSGITVGPLRNGVPCRSKVAGDPLIGVQLRILKRTSGARTAPPGVVQTTMGPRFSKLREDDRSGSDAGAKKAQAATRSSKKKTAPSAKAPMKPRRGGSKPAVKPRAGKAAKPGKKPAQKQTKRGK